MSGIGEKNQLSDFCYIYGLGLFPLAELSKNMEWHMDKMLK